LMGQNKKIARIATTIRMEKRIFFVFDNAMVFIFYFGCCFETHRNS